jgi:hypothetical protein
MPKLELTRSQEAYIERFYKEKKLHELRDDLGLKSTHNISFFLKSKNLKRPNQGLSESQKQFVRDNYLKYSECKIGNMLGLKSRYLVQKLIENEKLEKEEDWWRKDKLHTDEEGFFEVSDRQDWIF